MTRSVLAWYYHFYLKFHAINVDNPDVTHTHTHTHTQRQRDRNRERGRKREVLSGLFLFPLLIKAPVPS